MSAPAEVPTPPELVLLLEHLADSPVTAGHIRSWTQKDPVLARVLEFVRQGWPGKVVHDLSQFFAKKEELSVHEGCILREPGWLFPHRGESWSCRSCTRAIQAFVA